MLLLERQLVIVSRQACPAGVCALAGLVVYLPTLLCSGQVEAAHGLAGLDFYRR